MAEKRGQRGTPRGLTAFKKAQIGANGSVWVRDYSTTNALLTFDSTGMRVRGGIRLSNQASGRISSNSTSINLLLGLKLSNVSTGLLTANSTGVVFPGGVQISAKKYLTADSTGYISSDPIAALPGAVDGGVQIAFIQNSTGNVAIGINTTGTTWKYLATTAVLPT